MSRIRDLATAKARIRGLEDQVKVDARIIKSQRKTINAQAETIEHQAANLMKLKWRPEQLRLEAEKVFEVVDRLIEESSWGDARAIGQEFRGPEPVEKAIADFRKLAEESD